MPNFGAIYIVHNPRDGEHVYKVGKTERDVPSRILELNADTTNLGTYSACAFFVVTDVNAAEQACHNRLKQYRLQANREFFELELRRLLPLLQETIQPFLAQNLVPEIASAGTESRANLKLSLAERLKIQREHGAKAAGARRSQEAQSKTELLATIDRWTERLRAKIPVVQEAFADLDFIRWDKDCYNLRQSERTWIGPGSKQPSMILGEAARGYASVDELAARIQARDEYKAIPNAYKDRALRDIIAGMLKTGTLPPSAPMREDSALQRPTLPLFARVMLCCIRTGKTEMDDRGESLQLDGKEQREKRDNARVVGELLMVLRERAIEIAAFSVHGQADSIQGAASCSSPDEAVDLLGALISEYAANPITGTEPASTRYRTALLEGTAGGARTQA